MTRLRRSVSCRHRSRGVVIDVVALEVADGTSRDGTANPVRALGRLSVDAALLSGTRARLEIVPGDHRISVPGRF